MRAQLGNPTATSRNDTSHLSRCVSGEGTSHGPGGTIGNSPPFQRWGHGTTLPPFCPRVPEVRVNDSVPMLRECGDVHASLRDAIGIRGPRKPSDESLGYCRSVPYGTGFDSIGTSLPDTVAGVMPHVPCASSVLEGPVRIARRVDGGNTHRRRDQPTRQCRDPWSTTVLAVHQRSTRT